MKKSISVIIALFIIFSVYSQNKKGIIYEYKKNQATVAVGSSGNVELGYFKRFTKNFSIGLSLGRAVSSKYSYITNGGEVTIKNVVFPLFFDLKYNFLVRKRLQPSLIISPGVNLSEIAEFEGLLRNGFGLDYHFKSDNHVITAMANTFRYNFNTFNSFTLRYSYKF